VSGGAFGARDVAKKNDEMMRGSCFLLFGKETVSDKKRNQSANYSIIKVNVYTYIFIYR
jgi:hypothetical protein